MVHNLKLFIGNRFPDNIDRKEVGIVNLDDDDPGTYCVA